MGSRMDCHECRKWWSPYLDSELDASKTFEVSEHLRACAECRDRFERETYIENWLRERLKSEKMPQELWGTLCREVRSQERTVRFPFGRILAVAASVLFLVAGSLFYWRWLNDDLGSDSQTVVNAQTVQQSVSDLLQDRMPTLVAFPDEPASDCAKQLAELSRQLLHAEVAIDLGNTDDHTVQLVSVTERKDATGAPYIEVCANCCGRPVLLAISQRKCHNCIVELRKPTDACERKCRSGCPKTPPIKVESIERSGVMIAAATADHYLTGMFKSISVTPVL